MKLLALVYLYNIALLGYTFYKKRETFFNLRFIQVALLSFFLFGSSIISLLFNIFEIGPLLSLMLLLSIFLFDKEKASLRELNHFFYLIIFIAFTLFFFSIFAQNSSYALYKSFFFILTIILVLISFTIFQKKEELDMFFTMNIFWISLYLFFLLYTLDFSTRANILSYAYAAGENRIVLARIIILLIISTYYYYMQKGDFKYQLMIHFPVSFLLILLAGSRGPLLAFFITLFMFTVTDRKFLFYYISAAAVVYILIFHVIGYEYLVENVILFQRLSDISESVPRIKLFNNLANYLQNISMSEFLFGIGFGDSIYVFNEKYPHNLLLEFFIEIGITGLIIAVIIARYMITVFF
jgi:hypothetical protein